MNLPLSKIKVIDSESNRVNSKSPEDIIYSVEKEGVLVPVLVYQDGEDYILVAGHRRVASARYYNLETIPVEVIEKDRAETARALENIDRKNLHPLDEALEISKLMNIGYSRTQISTILEMTETKVARRVKLLNLCDKVKKAFKDGEIDVACAEEFAVIDKNLQKSVFDKVCSVYSLNPNKIRDVYFSEAGIELNRVAKNFLSMKGCEETNCKNCPHNPVSEEVLFAECETKGVCKNFDCYMNKLLTLVKKNNAKGLCFYRQWGMSTTKEKIKKYCKEKNIVLVDSDEKKYSKLTEYHNEDRNVLVEGDKYISIFGTLVYDEKTYQYDETESASERPLTRKQELAQEFDKYFKSFDKARTDYLKAVVNEVENSVEQSDRNCTEYLLAKHIVTSGISDTVKYLHKGIKEKEEDWVESLSAKTVVAIAKVCCFIDRERVFLCDTYFPQYHWYGEEEKKVKFNRVDFSVVAQLCSVPVPEKEAKALDEVLAKIDALYTEVNEIFSLERAKEKIDEEEEQKAEN